MLTILTGPDTARYRVLENPSEETMQSIDEIDDYWQARYLSAGEAVWRILGFHVTKKEPAVTALPIHLPSSRSHHQYQRTRQQTSTLSHLDHYFRRPSGSFIVQRTGVRRDFKDLTYAEYFTLFRRVKWDARNVGRFFEEQLHADSVQMHIVQRDESKAHLSRLEFIQPSRGELFYLRTILQHCPLQSFEDALDVNGTPHATFQEAAIALGLFAERNEAQYALQEAVLSLKTPRQLRQLFVHLLTNDCVPAPQNLWDSFREEFCLDYSLQVGQNPHISQDCALEDIARLLEEHGKTPADFGLREATVRTGEVLHEMIKWGSNARMLDERAERARRQMTVEQAAIYDQVITAVHRGEQLMLFVDGKAGRGKTFLLNAICDKIRSQGKIVLPTATAAFAAQLYPGGRTTHSTFKVRLLQLQAYVTCLMYNPGARQ